MNNALVLDAGALIGIERRSPRMQELVTRARLRETSLVVPTAVVAQVVRDGRRQANVRRFLADSSLRFADLDYATALEVGLLLGASATTTDVVDACVVVCSRRLRGAPVVTSDPSDIRLLDPDLPLIAL